MDILLIIGGLALLFAGGEVLIRGAVAIATALGLSTLLVSTVIVGFGTSTPELVVSVNSALVDSPAIALGNVVGSNIANVLLILGISAIVMPICCKNKSILRDSVIVLMISLALAILSLFLPLNLFVGVSMIALLAAYIGFCIWNESRNNQNHEIEVAKGSASFSSIGKNLAICGTGLALLIFGARFLLDGAVSLATNFGISEAVIGLTIVAVGTSLPELITAIIASFRKQSDVVIGNILGSNLFNILGILGVTGIISTIPFDGRIAEYDIWIMTMIAALTIPIIWTGHKISRIEGAVFVALYIAYTVWLFWQG